MSMGEILIGGAVGAGVLYVWGWNRFKYIRAYWRNNARAADFERELREARAALSDESPYRTTTPADSELVRWRETQAPDVLLDADLRASLGEHYPKLRKAWARRLRGRLPQATARRV